MSGRSRNPEKSLKTADKYRVRGGEIPCKRRTNTAKEAGKYLENCVGCGIMTTLHIARALCPVRWPTIPRGIPYRGGARGYRTKMTKS